jgi:anaerobic selenocysteine-containing dehydrogenase
MAGNVALVSTGGGTITVTAASTASNFTLTVPAVTGVLVAEDSTTGGAYMPVGTTAQQPSTPTTGQLRFNTTTVKLEYYNGSAWKATDGSY